MRNSTHLRPANTKHLGKYVLAGQQVHINDPFPYKDYRYDQDRAGHQQTRFDKRYNRQYSPNYNYHQPSPLVSISSTNIICHVTNNKMYVKFVTKHTTHCTV